MSAYAGWAFLFISGFLFGWIARGVLSHEERALPTHPEPDRNLVHGLPPPGDP